MRNLLILILIALALAPKSVLGAGPTIPAVRIADPPMIDGDLSDACWQGAPHVQDFYFLPNGSSAPEATTAWICYDEANVYVAFHCKDSAPDKIVAQQKKRGGVIDTDDWVGFDLDTYNTFQHAKMSSVYVSAGGVQVENLQSGDVSKIEWKGDWRAASKRTADGYAVEIAIPWSILQYDPAVKTMGVAFIRRHARTKQEWWAPNLGLGEDPKNYYVWTGLNLPRPSTRPLVLGYTLIGAGDDAGMRAGLDVKHAITPSLTGVLTFNPDFRNVEQDVESIDFTYTEKYRPDSRPFFQDGGMYFPGKDMFYSRPIGQIDYGAKVSGRYDQLQIAAMNFGTFGDSNYSMLHIGREWPAKGNIRIVGVSSDTPDGTNLAYGASGGYRVYDKNDIKLHLAAKIMTADAASGEGGGQATDISLFSSGKPRVLAWQLNRVSIDSDFDPYLGYVPDKGIEGWQFWTRLYDEKSSGKVTGWQLNVNYDTLDRKQNGSRYHDTLKTTYSLDWRNGRSIQLSGTISERIPDLGGPMYNDNKAGMSYLWGTTDLYTRGGFGIDIGRMAGGDYLSYGLGQAWRAGDRLSCSLDYYYARISEPSPYAYSSSQLVGSLAYDIDNEKTLAGRIVAEGGKMNAFFSYKQRVRHGMDVYVIYGDPNSRATRNTFLLKLMRPI